MKRTVKAGFFMSFMFVCMLATPAFSQTLKEFFSSSETPAMYLGIDFTKAKLIDDAAANTVDIRDRQYTAINELVVSDAKKFDFKGAFHKSNIDHDLGTVNKRNTQANAEEIKSTSTADFHRLKEADIANLVKGFDFGDKKGIGILFVMEAMSKSGKAAAIWVTFTDMKAKKILFTERVEAKLGGGFGFRNYWASTIKNLLDAIEKSKYDEWKSKYQ